MSRRLCYKLEIIWIKYIPIILCFIITLNHFLHVYDLGTGIIDYLFLPSLITILNFYLLRKLIGLCRFHRVFIDYIAFNWIIKVLDYTINVHSSFILFIYTVSPVVFLTILSYYYVKDNPKIAFRSNRKNR